MDYRGLKNDQGDLLWRLNSKTTFNTIRFAPFAHHPSWKAAGVWVPVWRRSRTTLFMLHRWGRPHPGPVLLAPPADQNAIGSEQLEIEPVSIPPSVCARLLCLSIVARAYLRRIGHGFPRAIPAKTCTPYGCSG